jgi:hypothetical protein
MFDPFFMLAFVAAEILLVFGPIYWLTKRFLPNAPTFSIALVVSVSGIIGFHFVGVGILLNALPFRDFPIWARIGIPMIPGLALPGLVWFAAWLIFRAK